MGVKVIYKNCPNCRTRLKLIVSNSSKPFVCPKCETCFSENSGIEISKKTLKFKWNGAVDLFDKTTYGPSEVVLLLWLTLAFIWFFYILFGLSRGGEEKASLENSGQRDSEFRRKPSNDLEGLPLPEKAGKSRQGKIDIKGSSGKIELDLVIIPAGKFVMGDRGNDHEVVITKPFYMGKYEVTQEQWEEVMGENPSETKGVKYPVTNVSWHDCQEFINKLNDKTKPGYRLPTEAEWEYACRAGTTTAYSFGDKITPKDANYGAVGRIKAVGSYNPNAFGLYDMHGNVWEWCSDWFGAEYYKNSPLEDPQGPPTGTFCVFRGGSIGDNESFARSFKRNFYASTNRNNLLGFRLARTANYN